MIHRNNVRQIHVLLQLDLGRGDDRLLGVVVIRRQRNNLLPGRQRIGFPRRPDRFWFRVLASGIDGWQEVRGAVVDDLVVNLERGIALLLDSLEETE